MQIEEMIDANRADCSGCEACANICPKNAIEMTRDAEGFAYPKINPELCIKCGRCDATCPALNYKKKIPAALPETFAVIYPNDKVRRHSSSGGAFTAFSEIILNSGGVVFGAGFDKNWRVVHSSAKNFDELENLRGSKYTQSRIGDVYRQVRDALQTKKVLFSGTPCQCAGLKHFLDSDPDNLLTVEIICHGTPSPALWEHYIDELAHRNEIAHVNFRSKRYGWGSFFEVNYFDRGHYISNLNHNLYGKLFLSAVSERPSCSSCKFRVPNGQADLTMGDAWGVKDFAPEMFDSLGTSVIFIHTQKGKDFFMQAKLVGQQVSFIDATRKNPLAIAPTAPDPRRENFFVDLANNVDMLFVMERYYAQQDDWFRQQTNQKNQLAYQENLQDILSQIRHHFEKNILFVAAPNGENEQDILNYLYAPQFQNCGIYFLQVNSDGNFTITEMFSFLSNEPEDTSRISDFVEGFNIAEIHVDDSLGNNFPDLNSWLNNCDLPVQYVSLKAD